MEHRVLVLFSEVVELAFCSSSVDSQASFILLQNQKLKECSWVSSCEYPGLERAFKLRVVWMYTFFFTVNCIYKECWNSLRPLFLLFLFIHCPLLQYGMIHKGQSIICISENELCRCLSSYNIGVHSCVTCVQISIVSYFLNA